MDEPGTAADVRLAGILDTLPSILVLRANPGPVLLLGALLGSIATTTVA